MAEPNDRERIGKTVYELSLPEQAAATDAFKRAHGCFPHWGLPSDRAWMEGYAAGRNDGVNPVDGGRHGA